MSHSLSRCAAMPSTDAVVSDKLGLTDTHAHLSYVAERQGESVMAMIAEAYAASGASILDPGVDYDDFPARKALLGRFPFVRFAAGIWPDAASIQDRHRRVAALEEHIRDPSCVAVGECGLDYHWMNGSAEDQADLFRLQLEFALAYSKPLLVHSRNAHEDTLSILGKAASTIPVVIHCFGYDKPAALEYVRAGCFVSFAGNMTYGKSTALREACAIIPDDRLLLETDAPYMNPEPRRGKDSSPLDIGRTYDAAALARNVGVESLSALVAKNAQAVFGPAWAAVTTS
jgi:TatD DNase family protein